LLLLLSTLLYAQTKECGCASDSMINNGSINCSSKRLSDGSELYWQINCERVWLTLKRPDNKKIVLDEVPIEYFGYTFRLGFQLAKEYKQTLLFRSGCPANGPCNFILVDKRTGKKVTEFGELIYNHTTREFYDFVIYFSRENQITLNYIENSKEYTYKVNPKDFNALIPEYMFKDVFIRDNILHLLYLDKEILIDLKTMKRKQ
jgi:hypothetical protein